MGCEFSYRKYIANFHKNIKGGKNHYKTAWNNVKGRKELYQALKDGLYGSVLSKPTFGDGINFFVKFHAVNNSLSGNPVT